MQFIQRRHARQSTRKASVNGWARGAVAVAALTLAAGAHAVDYPTAGTYTITHPYGVETVNVTTPGRRASPSSS